MRLEIEPTKVTPKVLFDTETSEYTIVGRSLPELGIMFYEPVVKWVKDHAADIDRNAQLEIKLDYCNTDSYKGLMRVFKAIENMNTDHQAQATVVWYYDKNDEDWLEDGRTFEETLEVPFKFVVNE